jgi:hypothetical protein
MPLYTEHDAARRPFATAFNKRLVERPDGELAIQVDIEVFDENAFSSFGGFSIGLLGSSRRIGEGETFVQVLMNPRQFDLSRYARDLMPLVPSGSVVEVTEYDQKADVPSIAIAVIVVLAADAVRETWKGYWNAFGARLLDLTAKAPRKDVGEPAHLQIHLVAKPKRAKFILQIEPEVTAHDLGRLDLSSLASYFLAMSDLDSIDRVVATIRPGLVLHLEFLVRVDGTTEKPPPGPSA